MFTTRTLFGTAIAATLIAGCGTSPVAPKAAPKATAGQVGTQSTINQPAHAPGAQAEKATTNYLRISYVTGNGMMGTMFTMFTRDQLRLQAYVSNPANRRLTYRWSGFGISGWDARATYNGNTPGNYNVTLNVSDDQGNRDAKYLWITVRNRTAAAAQEMTELFAPSIH